jgi:hypothetical protein
MEGSEHLSSDILLKKATFLRLLLDRIQNNGIEITHSFMSDTALPLQ